MTTGRSSKVRVNPIITVPLHKGVPKSRRISGDVGPLSPTEYEKIQVPLYKGLQGMGYQNKQAQNKNTSMAPPVPVRVGMFCLQLTMHNAIDQQHKKITRWSNSLIP